MNGCVCIDVVKVQGWCYLCLKRRANLIGYGGDGDLTPTQFEFIGAVEDEIPDPPSDPWTALLRGLDEMPVQPWERTSEDHVAGRPRGRAS